jgi:hypothetical protein
MSTIAALKERYVSLDGPCSPGDDVAEMETAVGLVLPDDIRAISRFYRGGMLGGISHFTWATQDSYGVVEKTLAARKTLNLPTSFLFLAEPAESAIVWRKDQSPAVVWCHAHDFERVVRGIPATSDVTEFQTYLDFFRYLLDTEEEERDA